MDNGAQKQNVRIANAETGTIATFEERMQEEVLPKALAFLQSRSDKGVQTYGSTLHTHDGRDSTLDALEEAADLYLYLMKKWLEEQEK